MAFTQSLEKGKVVEALAEDYFRRNNYNVIDVRDNTEFRKIDIDYIVDGLGFVEVKSNFTTAKKGKEGKFFWIELSIDDNDGWWKFSKATHFLFLDEEGSGVLIHRNTDFINFINDAIENGDHDIYGDNRFDYKQDERYNKIVTAKNMRVYLENIPSNIELIRIINGRKARRVKKC
jgi:hypothetical protein